MVVTEMSGHARAISDFVTLPKDFETILSTRSAFPREPDSMPDILASKSAYTAAITPKR